MITSAADYQKWHPRPNFSLSAPLFGLPRAPEWPGPPPLLNGHLVPVFLEKNKCSPASASRDRIFEYLGYHRIVSIEYYARSSTRSLSAQELPERLYERYNEPFSTVPRISRFPTRRTPREWLDHLDIDHAVLTIESVEAPKADEDTIPQQQGRRGKGRVKAGIEEEGEDGWVMVPEPLTSEYPKQQGQRGNRHGEAVIKEKGEDDWFMISKPSSEIVTSVSCRWR